MEKLGNGRLERNARQYPGLNGTEAQVGQIGFDMGTGELRAALLSRWPQGAFLR